MGTIPVAEEETNVKTPAAYFISDNDILRLCPFSKKAFFLIYKGCFSSNIVI